MLEDAQSTMATVAAINGLDNLPARRKTFAQLIRRRRSHDSVIVARQSNSADGGQAAPPTTNSTTTHHPGRASSSRVIMGKFMEKSSSLVNDRRPSISSLTDAHTMLSPNQLNMKTATSHYLIDKILDEAHCKDVENSINEPNVSYMLNPDSVVRRNWDIVVACCCMYIAWLLPFKLGFGDLVPEEWETDYLKEVNEVGPYVLDA